MSKDRNGQARAAKIFSPIKKAQQTIFYSSRPLNHVEHKALGKRYGFSTNDLRIGGRKDGASGDERFLVVHENSVDSWFEALEITREQLIAPAGENVFHMRIGGLNLFTTAYPAILEMIETICEVFVDKGD